MALRDAREHIACQMIPEDGGDALETHTEQELERVLMTMEQKAGRKAAWILPVRRMGTRLKAIQAESRIAHRRLEQEKAHSDAIWGELVERGYRDERITVPHEVKDIAQRIGLSAGRHEAMQAMVRIEVERAFQLRGILEEVEIGV